MRGWLTPESLTPDIAHVRRLIIPGDAAVLAAVTGALLELTYANNWEEQGAATPQETADAMLTMYNQFVKEKWNLIGMIVPCATQSTPGGCLECDGSVYPVGDYPALVAVLDRHWLTPTGYFTVPDLQARVPMGIQTGWFAMGAMGGEQYHTLSSGEMPAHTHSEITATAVVINGGVEAPAPSAVPGIGVTGSAGLGQSHNNLQPYTVLRFVIIAE